MAGPQFTGTHASFTTDMDSVTPFAGVVLSDPDTPNATERVSIHFSGPRGTLADGSQYHGPDTLQSTYDFREQYYFIEGPLTQVNQELDALSFVPNSGQVGTTASTTLLLSDISSSGLNSGDVSDSGTVVYNTTTREEISISPQLSYAHGVFTIAGYASPAAGITSVEISADVDGVATDLGAAAVDADGSFTFRDRIGRHTQSFITAIATSGIGAGVTSAASFSLAGGLGPNGGAGEQTRYTPDGTAVTAIDTFKPSGSQNVAVKVAGQSFASDFSDTFNNGGVPETTFVFNPGHGLDIVNGFRKDGTDHDTLSFTGPDFGNSVAQVLQDTYQIDRDGDVIGHRGDPIAQALNGISKGPGVIVYDPVSMDTVKVNGITKGQLAANQADIRFHG